VLLTSGITAAMNTNPFSGPMISLPLQVFDFVRSPEPTMVARGFGTAAVLLVLVLTLFMAARALGGRNPGDLSNRQRRAARAGSQRDEQRFAARSGAEITPTDKARRAHATAPVPLPSRGSE
jgi:phosphate transport system permease protein